MYPKFTLYPNGGAFMMCESVSEYDSNMHPPETTESQRTELHQTSQQMDPVLYVINKLKPAYDRFIIPMLNMGYDADEDFSVTVSKFEHIASGASIMVNVMRCVMIKLKAMLDYYTGPYTPIQDKFNSHMGIFMKNTHTIRQQGVEYCRYEYSAIPAFSNTWDIRTLMNLISNRPELLDGPIFASTLKPFYSDDCSYESGIIRCFDGMVDLMQCVYEDSDRMARLEATEGGSVTIGSLLSADRFRDSEPHKAITDQDAMVQNYLKLASRILRDTSKRCYVYICDITDGDYDSTKVSDAMRFTLMRLVNLFAVGTIVVMSMATSMRVQISKENALNAYTDLLLNLLKTI